MKEDKIRRQQELRAKNKSKSKDVLPMILTAIMILLIAILSYSYYLTTAVDKSSTEKIQFEVKESYGSSVIAQQLEEKGLIKSATLFKVYSRLGSSNDFYVGQFSLSKNMNMSEIMNVLTNKTNAQSGITLSIIEGDNIPKIAAKVEKVTDISAEQFIEKVNDEQFINQLKQEFPELITNSLDDPNIKFKLEGYLYPAGYNIDNSNKSNAETLIRQILKTTQQVVVPDYKSSTKKWNIAGVERDITIHEYITLASILEKESTTTTDNNGIAGVFLNRLKINMQLQTDPSVYYAAQRFTADPLTIQELQSTDPYNTYKNLGLPPGPISMPSQKSYEALNGATQHNYLYFLTDKEGKAYFAETYAEHEKLAREHVEGYISTN